MRDRNGFPRMTRGSPLWEIMRKKQKTREFVQDYFNVSNHHHSLSWLIFNLFNLFHIYNFLKLIYIYIYILSKIVLLPNLFFKSNKLIKIKINSLG